MSTDAQGTKWRRKIAEIYNRLSVTDRRQTDGRQQLANVNVSSRSLKITVNMLWASNYGTGS